jgi:hypothetical protein
MAGHFDNRKFRQHLRHKFDHYNTVCKFAICKNDKTKKYKDTSKDIVKLISDTINDPRAKKQGNVFVLLNIMDGYFKFLADCSQRILHSQNPTVVDMMHDTILQKQEELKDALISNKAHPIPLEDFVKTYIPQSENENDKEDVVGVDSGDDKETTN